MRKTYSMGDIGYFCGLFERREPASSVEKLGVERGVPVIIEFNFNFND